jgi:predicted nucleotidyltransferase component of viral defense system
MASSPIDSLSQLQRDVLKEFFRHEASFFLTGGAALAGFHLGHRRTDDLDLFTMDAEAFERAPHVMAAIAEGLGASLQVRQDAPGFRRYALQRGDEALVVDVVHERVPQVVINKPRLEGIAVDPPEEILANKLTTLVGRREERDLVDVYCLERAGYRVEDALAAALDKDGGCTPANLAWLLSQFRIPNDASLPGGIDAATLTTYVRDLVARLRRVALPQGSPPAP